MKLTVQQKDFAAALSAAARVVNPRTTLPVLANLLLEAAGGRLIITGSNLETTIRRSLPARVTAEGAITLPAKLLTEYVAQLNDSASVDLTLDETTAKVHLASGRYRANIAGIAAGDFPPVPEVGGTAQRVLAAVFKKAIAEVVTSAAPDDTRPVLAGVLVGVKDDELTLAAADGFRLAVSSFQSGGEVEWSAIVPAKALAEVGRSLPEGEDDVVAIQIAEKGSAARFVFGDTEVTSRLITGQFPDYQRIIPPEATSTVTVSRVALAQANRAADVFARDDSSIVRLQATCEDDGRGTLTIRSTSAMSGDTETTLVADVAADAEVALNAKYIKDALGAIDTDTVTLSLNGPASPVVIRPYDSDGYLVVIMPMHVAK